MSSKKLKLLSPYVFLDNNEFLRKLSGIFEFHYLNYYVFININEFTINVINVIRKVCFDRTLR